MPEPTAEWNCQAMLWEQPAMELFSGQRVPFSETWPTSGMTRNGRLFPLPASEHHTSASGFSSSQLMPTPTTQPDTGNGHARNLGKEARLLPTPKASDGTKGGPNQRGSKGDLTLPSAVHRMQ